MMFWNGGHYSYPWPTAPNRRENLGLWRIAVKAAGGRGHRSTAYSANLRSSTVD